MKIAIDSGHGSQTPGKRTPKLPFEPEIEGVNKGDQLREHIANVGVCVLLEEELRRNGFEIFRSGYNDANSFDDMDEPLNDRTRKIALANCDLTISIHFNAHGNGTTFNDANGVEIYIHDKHTGNSNKLAKNVLKELLKGTKQKDRGIKKYGYAMCNCNSMDVKAAILIELGFMTNLNEAKMMADKKYWLECAREIAKGVCAYTGRPYMKDEAPVRVFKNSSTADIKWLQEKLNLFITDNYMPPLTIDGVYGDKTRLAVLYLWHKLGWNKDGTGNGWFAGTATIEKIK